MANPLKTEHAIDWSQTAQEIEDHYQSGMIERDRYRAALEEIGKPDAPIRQGWAWEYIKIARKALKH